MDPAGELERRWSPVVNVDIACRLPCHLVNGVIRNSRVHHPTLMQTPASFHSTQGIADTPHELTGHSGSRPIR